ncbi:Kinesin-like protein KIN-14K [Cardamine amara subsp. amara]|uniref:Kinesin-like protein KIN-14K n=1 Tax=Cardamine amara subsp. amara TaxID=228776 RepID=A0ABD0Z2H8_CARAN
MRKILNSISDIFLSMATETDGSISGGAMDLTLFPEMSEQNDKAYVGPSKPMKHTPKPDQTRASRLSISTTSSSKAFPSSKRPITGFSSSSKPLNRKQ